MLLYPKLEKLSTQRSVAKVLIVLFSSLAIICFGLIIVKYYLIDVGVIRDYVISSLEDLVNLDTPVEGSIRNPFSFNNNYFINLYIECFSGFLIVVAWLTLIKETQKIGGDPDWGLAWLAFAILFWCIGDLINILLEFYNAIVHKDQLPKFDDSTKNIIGRVISSCNSFCFLYSLRYLEFNENSKWKKLRDRLEEFHSIPLVIFLIISVLASTLFLGIYFKTSSSKLVCLPDITVSIITTVSLWIFFTEYYSQRDISYMKFLITIMVLVIVIVQISNFVEEKFLDQFYVQQGAPILSMVYRPFLMMLFLLTAFSSLRNEKEKQAMLDKRDMNHAVRGSLHILNKDIERLTKKEKAIRNYENTFALQDLAFRTKSIYDLHNLIHSEYSDAKISLENYLQLLIKNVKFAFDYTHLNFNFVKVKSIYVERSLLRKIGAVLTELITNSAKTAIKKSHNNNYPNFKITDKLLDLSIENHDIFLKIKISDNGIFCEDIFNKKYNGHGLSLIKRTILEDFEGKLSSNKSKYEGTEISIEIPLRNII